MRSGKPRVVLDTNVLVSGILFKEGNEAKILRSADSREIEVFVSPEILKEFAEVVSRPRFQLTSQELSSATEYVLSFAKLIVPRRPVRVNIRDPEDVKFLECVRGAKAHYLVTGDKDLLAMGTFDRARILTPSRFVQR